MTTLEQRAKNLLAELKTSWTERERIEVITKALREVQEESK